MTDYTQNVYFTSKDALTTGDPLKKIKGTEMDAELAEISTAIASKEDVADKGAANGYAPLNASTLLADAYLTANIPRLDGATNAFTGNMTVGGTLAVTGALTNNGATVWNSANDGAGSGLDADLLDGQQGSYYQPVSTLLTAVLAIDGAGSGIDADLLDGQQGSYYQSVSGLLSGILAVDGAGSGIDADLLDGSQGSAYAKYADASPNFTGTLYYNSIEVGYRTIPIVSFAGGTATTAVRGKAYTSSAAVTLPAGTFAAGDTFVIYNNSAGAWDISRGTSLVMYVNGTDSGTVSVAAKTTKTVLYIDTNTCVVVG